MQICFLSYELPPGTTNGIGSYIYRVSRALAQFGHQVTVIAGQADNQTIIDEPVKGVRVIRLRWEPRRGFLWSIRPTHRNLLQVAQICRELHGEQPFDIIEAPDYRAEAYYLLKDGITCPIVTKLHTPIYLYWEKESQGIGTSCRRILAHWLVISALSRLETVVIQKATRIHAPSKAISLIAQQHYGVKAENLDMVPYPYTSAGSSPSPNNRDDFKVLYVGGLEALKGVHLFATIIPEVVRRVPQAHFVFLGIDRGYGKNTSMVSWLQARLGELAKNCEFLGWLPHSLVIENMRQAAVCVFPSLWDNFPNVCLEAMAAEACVVGSSNGGMAEMIEDGKSGFLAYPEKPETFAEKIIMALSDPTLRKEMGKTGRQRVDDSYRPEVIIPRQIAAYQKAIEQFRGS